MDFVMFNPENPEEEPKKETKRKDDWFTDPRLDYLIKWCGLTLRIKPDRWNKMMTVDEHRAIILNFLNKPTEKMLFITIPASGILTPMTAFPQVLKSKSTYFIRVKDERITMENFRKVVMFGDVSQKPVDELATLIEEVFVPVLSNPRNHLGWPACVAEDIVKHVHAFRNTVNQIRGAIVRQTLLPMPPGIQNIHEIEMACRDSGGEQVDLHMKAAIEGTVIKWASQINDILKENPRQASKDIPHPLPVTEVEFWRERLRTLESIYDQMRDPRVKKMASYLELTNSSYLPCLKTLFRNVVVAITEARDICLYLKPLERYFGVFDEDFLGSKKHIKPLFHTLGLVWVSSKYYCNSSKVIFLLEQLSNMMIEACTNQLDPSSLFQGEIDEQMRKVQKCIDILENYMEEFEEARKRLPSMFDGQEGEPVLWNFHPRLVFQRIMDYVDRLKLVYDLFDQAFQLTKLEKVVVAGIKGRDLTNKVEKIFQEFEGYFQYFGGVNYDSLNIEDDSFVKDYEKFKEQIDGLDKRLAAIAVQAFEQCSNLTSMFKMTQIWGSILDRPLIHERMWPLYHKLIDGFNEELDTVKILYDKSVKEGTPTDPFFPPVAARLTWIHKLRERLKRPMEFYDELCAEVNAPNAKIGETEDSIYMVKKYEEMMKILDDDQEKVFEEWCSKIPEQIEFNLAKPLIIRKEDGTLELQMNFDPQLEAILREVKYLKILDRDNIPQEALALFDRYEELFSYIMNLTRTVEWYNWLRTQVNEVESKLINDELTMIDQTLDNIIDNLVWDMNNIFENINDAHVKVKDLYTRVKEAQGNLQQVLTNMDKWALTPLYTRKDNKKDQLLALEDRMDRKHKRYSKIMESSDEVANMLQDNYRLYFNLLLDLLGEEEEGEEEEDEGAQIPSPTPAPGATRPGTEPKAKGAKGKEAKKGKKGKKGGKKGKKGKGKGKKGKKGKGGKTPTPGATDTEGETEGGDSPQLSPSEILRREEMDHEAEIKEVERRLKWDDYLTYVDKLIAEMFVKAGVVSIGTFLDETESTVKYASPLLEVQLELQEPNIVFRPTLDIEDTEGFYVLIHSLIDDIITMGEMMPRVAPVTDSLNYRNKMESDEQIKAMIKEVLNRIQTGIQKALTYASEFEKYSYLWLENRQSFLEQFLLYGRLLTQEEIELLNIDETAVKQTPPTIEQFKEQIDLYEDLYKEVEALETEYIADGWLRVDVKPLRQAILNNICKWGNLFKQHLVDHVKNSIKELEDFCQEADEILLTPLTDDDYQGLLKTMEYLMKVKDRQFATDNMFEPLQNIIDLLKQYGVEFPEEVHVQLAELPDKWTHTKKIAVNTKQIVGPIQTNQVNLLRKRITLFELRQNLLRDQMKKSPLYNFDCENVYEHIDKMNLEILDFEKQLTALEESSALFEVNLPEFKAVKQCRKELKQLKQLWDYVYIVQSSIDDWKTTPWKKIDVENMEMECKKFAKEIRAFDKEMRGWDTYIKLEGTVKNMLTSLRAVTELQNPAIRERHWQQLMQTTKVKFVMDDDTTLSDLLDLNLHKYEEEVKNIVDKSVKEMSMEKTLKELDSVWAAMEFETETHDRTKLKLLRATEELIETLEENQVQLQNLLTSKFIGYFEEEVSEWQKKLSMADQVISVFFEVQRKWQYLESIFIGSEDIRSQLPEDSKRFEKLDKDFKEILNQMTQNLNVLKATNKPGLVEKLEDILSQLVLCEKSLNDYLETKRLAFPRFYFVSSADLLDILSNGNQPELVCRHLTKLYDSIMKLRFTEDKDGKSTKTAQGMVAKDHDEFVKFIALCDCTGKVEIWLNRVTDAMRLTLHQLFGEAVIAYEDKPREQWIYDWPAQVALCGTQIWWTTEVNIAFARLDEGYENALKDYQKKQIAQLNALINLLLGDLTDGDRQKIMTICTIDVHSRDVVAKMILVKVENSGAFQWQSQLRHRWDTKANDCFGNICDAQFLYQYEYLGNTPRLVITPLTDRCYITLTQSLHLIMGGAPAGPAGTGKTETTKDLGRALGVMVYVFNCSEQMDYKSIGNIYKGLSQTGAWGCFDEFNRISVEVLSVVAVQVKTIQDAIKAKKKTFWFLGADIVLKPTVGLFITMNPGYAGRTELPENLKALFRPCAMVVPDFELICEIMLIAEGFQEARLLARKFITLYTLCRELLSKQDHYDWGLRAIKSVLVVAGSLKRGDRQRPEDQVLMRALRDFNIPKIVTDDVPIFMGLIGDLFPALDVPRKRDLEFEKVVKKSVVDLKLQPEDSFVLKIVQLEELFAVRHSVFIVGIAGSGKSMVWKSLFRTYQNQQRKPHYNDLNPKAVTNDELFGIINPSTREWKDGLFSVIMRDQANMGGTGPKWIVLDGDIDPMWIESLNTVMDDNKVLTLASNERIALTKQMRLLFEISNLRTATPATVSRAGILYINPADLGWNPPVTSWIDTREQAAEKANLTILFDKYVPPLLDAVRHKFKTITPIPESSHLFMLCYLLEAFLTPANVPAECPKEWYEIYFVFACIWAFGSALFQDQLVDWRNEFSKWWVNEFKSVKFPMAGTVFSYYIEQESKKFLPWTDLVQKFELDTDIPLQSTLVSTMETTRLRYFMDILMNQRKPVMMVGGAGSGKSVIVIDKLTSLTDAYAVTNVPFNFYTTSEMLQKVLEKPLEKKAGRNFGPPGNKTMIYFIDDLNMPEVDTYGTVQPHTILRQYIDYGHWYDRIKLTLKDIHNIQFVSCMNPTAGSFTIDSRLQRHFCVFAVSFPTLQALERIYQTILVQHLQTPHLNIPSSVVKICEPVVACSLAFHQKMAATYLPTAIKFHYLFNLRDLSNIYQGILFAAGNCLQGPQDLIRLWLHEATRVYCDKLVEKKDIDLFNKMIVDVIKKGFEELDENYVFEKPLIYVHFAEGIGDPKYLPIRDWPTLTKLLNEALSGYNDLVGAMNLVLFEDAMYHVCRINRILEAPRGNALLVGVGGSGKQSLSRLAAFISSLDVFQIQLRKGYTTADLKASLAILYTKAGIKSAGSVFLMSDSQVASENFLVIINDLLASGEVPELYPDEDIENVINAIRPEVKGAGLLDSKENCWKFFIERVRKLLKVVLCFSPVGSTLRIRARKFPALVNCTAINWFHEWPQEALESVSKRFVAEYETLPRKLVESVSLFMSYVHTSVNQMSQVYLQNEKRYNYTTPKSFLEQIALYGKLLAEKTSEVQARISRLTNGLEKLTSTTKEVDVLKVTLASQEVILKEKNDAADKLIQVLSTENEIVAKEQAIAAEEEEKVTVIEEDISVQQAICAEDLRKAEPALLAAEAALDTLDKTNLTELKSFGSPPEAVVKVTGAVLVLFSKGKIPKDRSWKECKGMMGNVDKFLKELKEYDKENIHPDIVKAIQPYLVDPEFDPDTIKAKSAAASGLCSWVINIMAFYDVYLVVEPKKRALAKATNELNEAREKLRDLKEKLAVLEHKLNTLRAEFEEAIAAKMKCQAEADATAFTINIANRLVNGLASENVRWRQLIQSYKDSLVTMPGDVLLITAFISYVGCFMRNYRVNLMEKHWMPYLEKLKVPIPRSEELDVLGLLTDDAQIAQWNNEGLPSDRMSAENATILVNSARWPLLIDPQLQGIKWIKNKYGSQLVVIRLGQKNYLDRIERAIANGETVLIENIGETVDAVLDPVLGRALIKKGKVIKIGDKEIDYDPNFKLILQTKLANPHYKPEMQAQATLINFTVTRDGLEEQLLAEVVKAERPDLEQLKSELTTQQNNFKITLKMLEDDLLQRLSSAGEDILSDITLVENLETTKKTATEIGLKVQEAKVTSKAIDEAREQYRKCATRASLLYFILNELNKINAIYLFSLKAFSTVFKDAIARAPAAEKLSQRVENLLDTITFFVFMYTSRGLFERDKLIFMSHMALQILVTAGEVAPEELDFLLRFPVASVNSSPVEFLTTTSWGGIKTLSGMDEFRNLDKDIEGSAKRWAKFVESETPEKEKFPQEWKNKSSLQKLCMMRALRPDRMTYAIKVFIEEKLGSKFVEARTVEFAKSFEESSNSTPIFFILSAGVDPLKDVEKLGKKMGFTMDNGNFHNVSLGQGQEEVAENAMELAAEKGHWVILQNIHLVARWLPTLEKKMEQYCEQSHPNYRLYMSAEPNADPHVNFLPQGILESSIKITNEPPTGMLANLHKALDNFNQETLEMCSKEAEFKAFLFACCYFHAVVAERRKFGAQGWNRVYPFNVGDLTISINVLYNYLENNTKIPFEDLRYLFGEIMYGGHITDDWDRRLCRTYLEEYMKPELIDGELFFAPGFPAPPNTDYVGYHRYIDDYLPSETPALYGLHPNAEIGFLTTTSENLFRTIFEMQPRDTGAQAGGGISREDKIKGILEDIQDKLPEEFNLPELMAKVEDKTPYVIVAFQECERMNILSREMKRSLKELELGLKGELTVSSAMEELEESLFMDNVPENWTTRAYPSLLPLGQWFADFMIRLKELESWASDFALPSAVWLAGFFNPQSFLTAIMQQTARKNEWPLDKMCLYCDVTKKQRDEFTTAPREGAYVHGLYMEGARWDMKLGTIADAKLKELFPMMPVIYIRAITQDKQETKNIYECPVYKTRLRGPTFVWTFNLKTRDKPSKWTLAGVALLLQI